MEFREIRRAAVGQHDAAIAAVVGLAHGGVDADFRRDAGDDQVLDAAILQRQFEIGLVEGAFAGLVDHRLAVDRIELRNDVVARLAADENAPHRAGRADALTRLAALDLGGRRVRHVRAVTLARVNDQQAGRARRLEHALQGRNRGLEQATSLPSDSPKPPGSRKSRCMSMMISAVRSSATASGCGSAAITVFMAHPFRRPDLKRAKAMPPPKAPVARGIWLDLQTVEATARAQAGMQHAIAPDGRLLNYSPDCPTTRRKSASNIQCRGRLTLAALTVKFRPRRGWGPPITAANSSNG